MAFVIYKIQQKNNINRFIITLLKTEQRLKISAFALRKVRRHGLPVLYGCSGILA
jgi:hypothetical protein